MGCTQEGSAASPAPSGGGGDDATVSDAWAEAGASDGAIVYTVCPDGMDASFGSLASNLFGSLVGCVNICHTPSGAFANGNLDFQEDASFIYGELLGDGGGVPASNQEGTANILRVEPFDPDASILYIKLNLHTINDPVYGSGMPQNAPGTVCPPAIAAVREWILQGAPFAPGEDAGSSDAGNASD